jgi:mannose/fructose/N-acetylgalactosamine-specific phosphotransferase system component IID
MFDTIKGFGDQLFAVIVLVICAGITAHFCFGFGTKKAKETFVALILVLIVGTQFYHLIQAATYVPASKFYVFNVSDALGAVATRGLG